MSGALTFGHIAPRIAPIDRCRRLRRVAQPLGDNASGGDAIARPHLLLVRFGRLGTASDAPASAQKR
jgi:hypothetical protein